MSSVVKVAAQSYQPPVKGGQIVGTTKNSSAPAEVVLRRQTGNSRPNSRRRGFVLPDSSSGGSSSAPSETPSSNSKREQYLHRTVKPSEASAIFGGGSNRKSEFRKSRSFEKRDISSPILVDIDQQHQQLRKKNSNYHTYPGERHTSSSNTLQVPKNNGSGAKTTSTCTSSDCDNSNRNRKNNSSTGAEPARKGRMASRIQKTIKALYEGSNNNSHKRRNHQHDKLLHDKKLQVVREDEEINSNSYLLRDHHLHEDSDGASSSNER